MTMRRSITTLAATSLAIALVPGVALATPVIDQQNVGTANAYVTSIAGNYSGQTFTAGLTGPLTQIDVYGYLVLSPGPLTVAVYATSGGLPTGAAIATQTIPQAGLPTSDQWFSVVFANPATLEAGGRYALAFETPSATGGASLQIGVVVPQTYAGGVLLDNGPSWAPNTASADALFRTYVDVASGSGESPPPVLQQFGRPASGTCDEAAPISLNWGGAAAGGWGDSWAAWMNNGRGGAVCTRTLVYAPNLGRWSTG